MRSHYDVLGVTPDATAAGLRQAYRAQAARLHPDKHTDGGVDELAVAERDMRRLNEAWHVLSDPVRRRRYDEALLTPPPRAPIVENEPARRPVEQSSGDVGRGPMLVLVLPVALLLLALAAIFGFTGYARQGPEADASGTGASASASGLVAAAVGDCVIVRGGHVSQVVPCDEPNDGRVTEEVDRGRPCPQVEERKVDGQSGSSSLCLAEVVQG